MHKRYWLGLGIALAILLPVSVLVSLGNALLAGLILMLVLAIALYVSRRKHIQEGEYWIVCSRQHDTVLRVVRGPATTFLMPLREKVIMVGDTAIHRVEIPVVNALQQEGQPASDGFSVWVWFHLMPHELALTNVGKLIPTLDNPQNTVRVWVDYFLRVLISDIQNSVYNSRYGDVESLLKRQLVEQLKPIGIAIDRVRLIVDPQAKLHRSVTDARR